MHRAAANNQKDELTQLLLEPSPDNNTDPDAVDSSGQTALHLCADRGHVDCLSILIKKGANVDASDDDGITPLQAAVISGHVDACRLLLDAGANPDKPDRDGDTPRACADDDDQIKSLIDSYQAKA